jgi:hypothetical protein
MCPKVVLTLPLLTPFFTLALPSPLVGLSFLAPPAMLAARTPCLREDRRTQRSGNAEQRHQEHRPCRLHAFSVSSIVRFGAAGQGPAHSAVTDDEMKNDPTQDHYATAIVRAILVLHHVENSTYRG